MTRAGDWIPTLPRGWRSSRLRWLASIYSGGTPPRENLDYWLDGTVPWLNSGVVNQWNVTRASELITEQGFRESSAAWVPIGAVVMGLAGQGQTKGMVARTAIAAACNQSLCAIVPRQELEFRFLHFWLSVNHANLRHLAGGDNRDGLNHRHVGDVHVPLPPMPHQVAIANFLDRETAKIDALIDKQRGLISTLEARRAAVIENGLQHDDVNPSALGYHVTVLPGFAFASDDFSHDAADVRLLRGINIKPGALDWTDCVYWPHGATGPHAAYQLAAGDVVLGMDRPFVSGGTRVATVGPEDAGSLLVQRVLRLRGRASMDPRYLALVLASGRFRDYATPEFTGVSVPHLSDSQVRAYRAPVPSLDVQRTLVAEIDGATERVGKAVTEATRFITLAQERRSALITAAVTGQLDIGGAA